MPDGIEEIQRLRTEAAQIECLYQLEGILRDGSSDHKELFGIITELVPKGFRFPEYCRSTIVIGDNTYTNIDVRETELRIRENIFFEGSPGSYLSVCYYKPLRLEKGVFLPSEKKYLRSIADKIGDFLLIRHLRDTIRQQEESNSDAPAHTVPETLRDGLTALNMPVDTILDCLQQPVRFRKWEMLNKQGSDNPYLYLLGEGFIKNYIETGGDRKLVFKIVRPVDWIGTPLIAGRNSLFFSSLALTDALVYPVHKDDIRSLSQDVAEIIHQRFLVSMESNYTRLARLMTSQALGRVAIVIRYLSEMVFASTLIPPIISRRDIADMSGMSTESAVRMLSILRTDAIIATGSKGIEILDARMLHAICQAG